MAFKKFYYNQQVRKYALQAMAIFSDMQVQIGKNDRSADEEKLISVPIMYGNRDRVTGWIKGQFTQNKPLRLPTMSVNVANIELAPELRKGVNNTRRNAFAPVGGVVPDDIKVVKQHMPVPYRMYLDLYIWTSNTEQKFQILEQIMMLFDPSVTIQTTDNVFDWTKLTIVELIGIGFEDNFPIGTDRRLLISTLSFQMPIYISAPADVRNDLVKTIKARIAAVDLSSVTNEEIIADLDAQGILYEEWFTGAGFSLPPEC